MQKRGFKLYWKLFTATFLLSAFTFGGGYVIVPLMKGRFVDDLHWLEEQEMLDLTAIAQSAPGPIAVNASILVGWRVAGPLGSAVAILGTVLPPLIILSLLSLFYAAFRSNRVVAALLKGMQAGVAAVIASVVCDMAGNILKEKKLLPDLIMAAAFLATWFFGVNVAWIILVCALTGIIYTFRHNRRGGEGAQT
ncbi:chromate transporter [Pseudoflavonifractor sp. BIOML-A6]|jgi:chromate transport protein|nr:MULTISPECIES: chromate transporter [unclassified Pseudoflavonifractor]MTQ95262.1 chromate transporter [Pseudoflavonifractor sp. BIOML-A16]MTR07036.1 chromate transporter [Pseudoflavonifractor sp. BIOML-A15]MTR32274.1 chromate transporter [Pseudoflavonifractor sp. BIOML-A14]MTR72626.1 chromate transporter [Pseudoflavonifractor sp. BIOML-A18]MTS64119.1 chromate transporter [Pseudoflavonifractor sp. BIOML-A5]MTS70020.1 chromate transporter [Pseudoflavonifractor sp. BIOML-A8]MTS91709.1 chroma